MFIGFPNNQVTLIRCSIIYTLLHTQVNIPLYQNLFISEVC